MDMNAHDTLRVDPGKTAAFYSVLHRAKGGVRGMNWKEIYREKIVTADEAMQHIQRGDLIIPGDFGAEPVYLMEHMTKRAGALGNVKVMHGGNIGPEPHLMSESKEFVDFECLCAVPISRKALEERRADFVPCYFHEWPKLFKTVKKPDVALIQVTEPDENGMVSLGVSSDFTSLIPTLARTTIAQVNRNMPFIPSNTISIEQLDYLVLQDEPLLLLTDSFPGEVEKEIARHVIPLIHDGDCLQIGRGKLPDYVMTQLMDKKDLGIHTEMFSDGAMQLVKAGVINNSRKSFHPGKTVCSFMAGSEELYKWAQDNEDLLLLPVDIVNDPFIIAQNDNVVSLNSAIEVDLLGQAVADMIGSRQFTGVGGFTDFVRGAGRSKGGRSILAFASTSKDGKTSRIVPHITEGAAVAATRYDTNYVVTEYGAAQLWGKTNRERVEALIGIAHPKFRDELRAYAHEKGLIW